MKNTSFSMVLFYHKTGGNSLKFVDFGKKSEGKS